jgi:RNA polymerase sigma-70 factor (ECF subfamily)
LTPDDGLADRLLRAAEAGDREALDGLLTFWRPRLRQMIAVRLDPQLAVRADASDVVQEALMEASRRFPEYTRKRPVPFYLWLRQLACQRLTDLYRRHLRARRRSVYAEEAMLPPLPDQSAMSLANVLVASGTAPSQRMQRQEKRNMVRAALDRLAPADREVLVLRHLEQLSTREVAAILDVSEPAVRYRHRRALERLADYLSDLSAEGGAR